MARKTAFKKKRELIYRPIFSIDVNDPVGDHTALSKKIYEKWSSYSEAKNLLHNVLNLMKEDVAREP